MTNGTREAISELPELIVTLQTVVNRLQTLFPGRHFTLDGHLVGSLAEVLAAHMYDLELLAASVECHDGRCRATGINVQVKGTQRDHVALYGKPEHLIVLRLESGFPKEVYNGPGKEPWNAAGKKAKNGQRRISIARLRELAQHVPPTKRLKQVRPLKADVQENRPTTVKE